MISHEELNLPHLAVFKAGQIKVFQIQMVAHTYLLFSRIVSFASGDDRGYIGSLSTTIAKTILIMIINQACSLKVGIHGNRTEKREPSFLEISAYGI